MCVMPELFLLLAWSSVSLLLSPAHPLVMALSLVMGALGTSMMLGWKLSSWLLVALSMIFLGGMMVIFLYFTSLVPNEKLMMKKANYFILPLLMANCFLFNFSSSNPQSVAFWNFSFINLFIYLLMLIYLLLTLILVVELTSSFKGSLEVSSF